MRILTATQQTNGAVPGDYDHCVPGEIVYMQEPCASDLRDPDGPCGCGRGFAGTNSHHATSTALVTDTSLTLVEVREAIRSSLEAGGWLDPAWCQQEMAVAMVQELLDEMLQVAEHFPTGSIVRRRIHRYYVGTVVP